MQHETLRTQVRQLIGEMSPLGSRTAESTDRLIEDLGYDSLAVIELSLQLESQFSLAPMAQADAADITTVGDIEDFVVSAAPEPAAGTV
jgi:acyl carrier protein